MLIVKCEAFCYTTYYGTFNETQKSKTQKKTWLFGADENPRRPKRYQTSKSTR
jgi:hypothetical protein